jgi:electron transfer flavoprotein beta subunit
MNMRIVVCLKQIIDPEISPQIFQIDRQSKKAVQKDVALVINPYDENAIEVALQLKDRQKEINVAVLTLGGELSNKALRRALSMGCDEAFWLKDPQWGGLDSFGTAEVIAKGIRKIGNIDLVLCGRQAGDWDMGQVGAFLAESLSWPCATLVFKIDLEEGPKIALRREVEKGVEVLEGPIPLLATITSASTNQPRYPSAKGIMTASRKKITTWSAGDLEISQQISRRIQIEDLVIPDFSRELKIIEGEDGVEKAINLVRQLRELKAIQ